ncbi:MAG: protein translocase subunit SecF [Desulfobacula sp.]|jgi:preprotein translocase subunit SecF|uniref:protein translocase subunit SecF n=1 Tax=Desulfobacula sp. TaxID=2593537 RepID=UPI001D85F59A|nr:protein translocase subunit SecF [Desulfobacula sp.]MBT3487310.1 protein translocase subunit SecF [Desulfobacula sp.]MBT3805080.1 protein translocase subunit SecF [Desulfobacula sp.]MBT4025582.1 protein translocase subunit SecF [Desulfobacula sp.]MBT4199690.1 protein translocase subunit SecF [Desulfobacula sp.]
MQLIKSDINIDFIGKQKIGFILSVLFILLSIGSLIVHKGPNYGIDFVGGTIIQIKFSEQVPVGKIRSGLSDIGFNNASVQNFGADHDNEFLIRTSNLAMTDKGLSQSIKDAVMASTGIAPEIRRVEMVGPQVGKDLREKALLAIFYSLLFITIYISGRFELKWILSGVTAGSLMTAVYFLSIFNVSMAVLITAALAVTLALFWTLRLKYAMGAIVALLHDVLITIGIFSILDLDFSLPIIAALLTIIGYSLNDTIIVFDRLRENIKGSEKTDSLPLLFNKSINGTLSRTILTSLTTLIVLFALYFLGGEIIHNFAFAMIIGVIIGTYSSIFVASPIVLLAHKR